MRNLLFVAALLLSVTVLGQSAQKEVTIPVGTKFTVRLEPIGDNKFDIVLLKQEAYSKKLDLFDTGKDLEPESALGTNEVSFILAPAANKKMKNAMLIYRSNISGSYKFTSLIKEKKSSTFTNDKNSGIPSNKVTRSLFSPTTTELKLKDFYKFTGTYDQW